MTVARERVAAYADGELDQAEAKLVEAELEQSPELRAQLQAHRALKATLAGRYAPLTQQPVPERLIAAIRAHSEDRSNVVEIGRGGASRTARSRVPPRWTWLAAPALAASVALVVISPNSRPADYAGTELAMALDRQLVADQDPASPVRILLSFRDGSGRYCRGYSHRDNAGIACRQRQGWQVVQEIAAEQGGSTEYRQAGAPDALMVTIQEMAAGPALGAAAELEAKARGWIAE